MNGKQAKRLRRSAASLSGSLPIKEYSYKIHERKETAPIINDKGEITGEEETTYKSVQVRLSAQCQRSFYQTIKTFYKRRWKNETQ